MLNLKWASLVLTVIVALGAGTIGARILSDAARPPQVAPGELSATAAEGASPLTFSTDEIIGNLQRYLQSRPADSTAYSNLGIAYLQKARETADPTYYAKAEHALKRAQELDPRDFRTLSGLGALALSRHAFREAQEWGEQALKLNPDNADIYGVIGDAQIELGSYPEAFQTFQHMVDLRPGLPSYARVSYARELRGDLPGAIQAMQMAVDADAPASEAANWARVQLGNLYFGEGDYGRAAQTYSAALDARPGYPYAQAGLANVLAARGDYIGAISLYSETVKTMPLPQFIIAYGDILAAAGRQDDAALQYNLVEVEEKLFEANGVDVDVELALFDADHGRNLDQALPRAQAGYERRPSVTGADALAWTLFKTGHLSEAQEMMTQALRLGTRNALMYYHAGMIATALGQSSEAADYINQALSLNPHFSLLYADQAKQTLESLRRTSAPTHYR